MKNKIVLGMFSLILVIGLVACKDESSNQLPQNSGEISQNQENSGEIYQNQWDESNRVDSYEEFLEFISGDPLLTSGDWELFSQDFPENPVDALGNTIDFTDTLEPATIGMGSYKMTKDGTKIIDRVTNQERKVEGIDGVVKSFICDGNNSSSASEDLNFIVLTNEGELYGAYLEKADKTILKFKKLELSQKVKEIGIARGQEQRDGNVVLKTESGALQIIYCFPENGEFDADVITFIPTAEIDEIETL